MTKPVLTLSLGEYREAHEVASKSRRGATIRIPRVIVAKLLIDHSRMCAELGITGFEPNQPGAAT